MPASSRQCHAEGRGGMGKQGPGRRSLESNGAGPQPPAQPCSLLQHFRAQNPSQGSERHSSGQADPRASSVPHSGLLDGADRPPGSGLGMWCLVLLSVPLFGETCAVFQPRAAEGELRLSRALQSLGNCEVLCAGCLLRDDFEATTQKASRPSAARAQATGWASFSDLPTSAPLSSPKIHGQEEQGLSCPPHTPGAQQQQSAKPCGASGLLWQLFPRSFSFFFFFFAVVPGMSVS